MKVQMILYDDVCGVAAQPRRISRLNPERRKTIGLWPNHDFGQRLAIQKSNIPVATTPNFKPTNSGGSPGQHKAERRQSQHESAVWA